MVAARTPAFPVATADAAVVAGVAAGDKAEFQADAEGLALVEDAQRAHSLACPFRPPVLEQKTGYFTCTPTEKDR
jgi:hypothetical protein